MEYWHYRTGNAARIGGPSPVLCGASNVSNIGIIASVNCPACIKAFRRNPNAPLKVVRDRFVASMRDHSDWGKRHYMACKRDYLETLHILKGGN